MKQYVPPAPKALRGIILSGRLDQLVIEATPSDVATFGLKGQPVAVATVSPQLHDLPSWAEDPYLYDRHGQPVALIQSYSVSRDSFDVTSFSGDSSVAIAGLARIDIHAIGIRS